jgi:hypothetical protein
MIQRLRQLTTSRVIGLAAVTNAAIFITICHLSIGAAGAFQLITEQEAALPDDTSGSRRSGVTRGPQVIFVAPPPNAGLVTSPLDLRIKFKAYGGAGIDRDSIVVTYKKIPSIDLTKRLMPFVGADGIDARDAELSPGVHRIRIDVKDTDGRSATAYILIKVGK